MKPFAVKRAAMDAWGPKGRPPIEAAQASDPWSPRPHDRATAPSGMEGLPLACRSALVATFHRWRNWPSLEELAIAGGTGHPCGP